MSHDGDHTLFRGNFSSASWDLRTKFEISIYSRFVDKEVGAKRRNGVIWCGYVHSRSSAMLPIDRADTTFYSTLTETTRLSCTVCEINRSRGNEVTFVRFCVFSALVHFRGASLGNWHASFSFEAKYIPSTKVTKRSVIGCRRKSIESKT